MKLTFVDIGGKMDLLDWVQTKECAGKAIVFRFFALEMVGKELNIAPSANLVRLLSPHVKEDDETSRSFDEEYAHQLQNLPTTRYDLALMLEQLQLVDEVIIVCNYTHPTVEPIIDSLCKFIQQKYTFQGIYFVNDIEDIDELASSEFDTDEGYAAYIRDIEWMTGCRELLSKTKSK